MCSANVAKHLDTQYETVIVIKCQLMLPRQLALKAFKKYFALFISPSFTRNNCTAQLLTE